MDCQSTVTPKKVAQANREVYNQIDPERYDSNPSIFNSTQRRRIEKVLKSLRSRAPEGAFLDVGCGTGNLLTIASKIFPCCIGVDIADALLLKVAQRKTFGPLLCAEANYLPFPSCSFSVVAMYALLHHLYEPAEALAEAYRVLVPGGFLYTDHDPNYYMIRFYRMWYCLRYGKARIFGTQEADLAEYHHTQTNGLNPEKLAGTLKDIGFKCVHVKYRHSMNPCLKGEYRFFARSLVAASTIFPARSFFTHFMLIAKK